MASKIGTYGEKTLHRELKWRIDPTGTLHETPVGKYIADIKDENNVIEIQTQSFNKLRDKLESFLSEYTVTLVYPIAHEKLIIWIDENSGEIVRTRRSPKKGNYYHAFRELYRIKILLTNANLRIRLILTDVSERRSDYPVERNANRKFRRGKGYKKIDTIMNAIHDEMLIFQPSDYLQLIPASLPLQFTSADYTKATGLNRRDSGVALNVLRYVGAIVQNGKSGRKYLYERKLRET